MQHEQTNYLDAAFLFLVITFYLSFDNLINNPRMFNLGINDLAEKPYIPQKNLLL